MVEICILYDLNGVGLSIYSTLPIREGKTRVLLFFTVKCLINGVELQIDFFVYFFREKIFRSRGLGRKDLRFMGHL
jgi:hypothetical protein